MGSHHSLRDNAKASHRSLDAARFAGAARDLGTETSYHVRAR